MHLFFEIQSFQLLISYTDGDELLAILDYVILCIVYTFLHCFITLSPLISPFLHIRSLLIPYAYVSIESIVSILLAGFKIKAIFLFSSVKTLSLLLLNLCCVFNISLFFTNSFLSSVILATSIYFFLNNFLFSLFQLLLSSF